MKDKYLNSIALTKNNITESEIKNTTLKHIQLSPNLAFGALGGTLAMVILVLIWTMLAYSSGISTKYMVMILGLSVGFSVRNSGMGHKFGYGFLGLFITLGGCILGLLLSNAGFIAYHQNKSISEVLSWIDLQAGLELLYDNIKLSIAFYIFFALIIAYKLSINPH